MCVVLYHSTPPPPLLSLSPSCYQHTDIHIHHSHGGQQLQIPNPNPNPNHCNSAVPACDTYPNPDGRIAYTCPSLTDTSPSTSLQPHNPQQHLSRTLLDSLRQLILPLPGISTRMQPTTAILDHMPRFYTHLRGFYAPSDTALGLQHHMFAFIKDKWSFMLLLSHLPCFHTGSCISLKYIKDQEEAAARRHSRTAIRFKKCQPGLDSVLQYQNTLIFHVCF